MHKIDSTDSAKLPTSCGSWKTFTGTFTGMLTASELEGFLKKPAAFGTAPVTGTEYQMKHCQFHKSISFPGDALGTNEKSILWDETIQVAMKLS